MSDMATVNAIWAKTDVAGEDECWLWRGGTGQRGQPNGSVNGKQGSVRRTLYQALHGAIDHTKRASTTCGTTLCLNPAHLTLIPWHDDEARYWRFVQKGDGDACWIWTGAKFRNGYSAFRMQGKTRHAHRVAWELAYGPIVGHVPGDNEREVVVMHKCDNPTCVRPDHLELGSDADNIRDMWRKGRGSRGEKHAEAMRAAKAKRAS